MAEFTKPCWMPTGIAIVTVAIGDIDDDGRSDLVAGSWYEGADDKALSVLVFRQLPGGGFGEPEVIDAVHDVLSVAVGDVTDDGKNDVIYGNHDGVGVLVQEASGELGAPVVYPAPQAGLIRLGNLDGDELLDVAAIDALDGTRLSVLLQEAGGLKLTYTVETTIEYRGDLAVGDFTGDGRDDVAIVRGKQLPTGALRLFKQLEEGGFEELPSPPMDETYPYNVEIGDLNGDGRSDVVVAGVKYPAPRVSSIFYFRQDESGGLQDVAAIPTSPSPMGLLIEDVTCDGRRDLLVAHGGYIGVHVQRKNGTLGGETQWEIDRGTGIWPHHFAVGDLNSDGKADIAAADEAGGVTIIYHR